MNEHLSRETRDVLDLCARQIAIEFQSGSNGHDPRTCVGNRIDLTPAFRDMEDDRVSVIDYLASQVENVSDYMLTVREASAELFATNFRGPGATYLVVCRRPFVPSRSTVVNKLTSDMYLVSLYPVSGGFDAHARPRPASN